MSQHNMLAHFFSFMKCHVMRFSKMWYVRPAKARTSLRIRTF